jgi:hypothetical protein
MYRSGTTWIARMLEAAGGVTLVSEPFNPRHRPGVLRSPFTVSYLYVTEENEDRYRVAIGDTLRLRYRPLAELSSLRTGRQAAKMVKNWTDFTWGRLARRRPLVKDPFAVLSAPWLARRFDAEVVVSVRHPAAVVSSTMRLGWKPFDFQNLLQQPLLIRDLPEEVRDEIERAAAGAPDVLEAASLLWKVIYGAVARFPGHPGIHVVRHEDLSLQPVEGFDRLYGEVGLPFSDRARATIAEATSSANPQEQREGDPHSVRLDSRANIGNWQRRLSPDDVARIRSITGDVAGRYYSGPEWGDD